MLNQLGYPKSEIEYLANGFKNGFDIGYEGPKMRQSTAENIPFTVENKTQLWNKIMKEVKLGRVAGPYDRVPFDNYIQSPVGLVPKADNQTRLIFHLSYDCKRDGLKSLNYHTPKDKCSVSYKDIDYAIQAFLRVCKVGNLECNTDLNLVTDSDSEDNNCEQSEGNCAKLSKKMEK